MQFPGPQIPSKVTKSYRIMLKMSSFPWSAIYRMKFPALPNINSSELSCCRRPQYCRVDDNPCQYQLPCLMRTVNPFMENLQDNNCLSRNMIFSNMSPSAWLTFFQEILISDPICPSYIQRGKIVIQNRCKTKLTIDKCALRPRSSRRPSALD